MGINVLSCFDGISCGQIALERAGIEVDNYFASEIDKYAIKVTQTRYPKTVQLGTIENWYSWSLPRIDLIIAGSPCQGFSNAGHGLNFEDPRSKLFFTYCDILAIYKPEWYLLENVKMKKEWREIITDRMKVEPVLINSALVSAQNRKRLYWANWEFGQPEDKHIYLKDILEDGEVDREKSYCIDANYHKGGNPRSYFEDGKRQLVFTRAHGYMKESEKEMDKYPSLCAQNPNTKHLLRNKSNSVRVGGRNSPAKSKQCWDNIYKSKYDYRGLYVSECEKLQTLPVGYTDCGISNTQRYKCVGNGWTVDVVAHIFSALKEKLHGIK